MEGLLRVALSKAYVFFDSCCDEDLGRLRQICSASKEFVSQTWVWAPRCHRRWPLQVQALRINEKKVIDDHTIIFDIGVCADWCATYCFLRSLHFQRLWDNTPYDAEDLIGKMSVSEERRSFLKMWRACMQLPSAHMMPVYLAKRLQMPGDVRRICDNLVFDTLLPIPDSPDGKIWTREWSQPTFVCSCGVLVYYDVFHAMEDLFGPPLFDNVADLANRALDPDEGYHAFYLPFRLEGVLRVSFKCLFGGEHGALIGVADPHSGEPLLAFDICGGAPAVWIFDKEHLRRLGWVRAPGDRAWMMQQPLGVQVDQMVGEFRESRNPTEEAQRLTLEIDVTQARLVLYEGPDVYGHVIGTIEHSSLKVFRTRKRAKTRGIRDSVVFVALSPSCHEDEEYGSYVGVEAIERLS